MTVILQLFSLLTSLEKRNLFFLCGFMIINALVQIFGIASVAPLLAVITSPDSVESLPMLNQFVQYYEFDSHRELSIFLGCGILAIMVFGNAIILLTNYMSMRYANNREASIGTKLLKTYLYQPYVFFLDRNSSEILRNIYNEVAYIASNIIVRFLNVLTYSISALGIIIFIFIINPQITLILSSVLGGAYILIYLFIKKPLYYFGRRNVELTEVKMRAVNDSIRVIKDIRMRALEPMFVTRFKEAAQEYARGRTLSDLAGIMPKYIIEVFAIAALVFVIIYLISSQESTSEILPILGIYAFAGFRLMPALQQIFLALSKIQFSSHSLALIAEEVKQYQDIAYQNEAGKLIPVEYEASLALDDVAFSYGGDQPVVSDVNLNITKGSKVGIIGKSGEGKSTIVDVLVGLTVPSRGALVVDGKVLTSACLKGWRDKIAYTSQSVYLLDDDIDMNITLELDINKRDTILLNRAKEIAAVDFNCDGEGVGENGQRLSGGQKQRVGLARAFYQNKPILILDEATSALDVETERKILKEIAKEDLTLISITHRVETLDFCEKIFVVSRGKIAEEGSYNALKEKSEIFNSLLQSGKGE